eukprot:CAMPEP_0174304500 /NCGR_PEP_ID=MMETSP0809-20121228/60832_1 /TAXON_ID=73025 ORGANISM="Eutreptiella gymnastica-like, Strain CCMP1594" /NCGR_SAMPLE_ID=MMETSP0809 /ASSEMBLY_ACC=CAM_ASM_000658 /LENGTH=77 /DNA_ID=CAMNT_0015410753 /DNA_START=942 /DNA_END=1172 /DNA_ORIENTATION=+
MRIKQPENYWDWSGAGGSDGSVQSTVENARGIQDSYNKGHQAGRHEHAAPMGREHGQTWGFCTACGEYCTLACPDGV